MQRVKQFLEDQLNFELENFQLDSQLGKLELKTTAKWEEIDLIRLIETEDLLHASRKGKEDSSLDPITDEEGKVFDSFQDMNHATMLNIENAFKDVSIQN